MKIEVVVGTYALEVFMDVLAEAQAEGIPFVHFVEKEEEGDITAYLHVTNLHESRLREFLVRYPSHGSKFVVVRRD